VKRKIIATMTATLLTVALLPMATALANVNSASELVLGRQVFPANNQVFSIRVNNTEQPGPIPGQPTLGGGDPIRFVSIVLPSSDGIHHASEVEPVNGWDIQKIDNGSLQVIRFVGGTINPGSNFTFPFRVNVGPPLRGDQGGFFDVRVSSDAEGSELRRTTETGAGLTTLIRTLQITDLFPASPPLAISPFRDMTSGGQVVYQANLRNHARSEQVVSATLTSNQGADEIEQPGPVGVPAQGQASTTIPITVSAPSDRNHTFTLQASSERSSVDPAQDVYRVLGPADLTLNASQFAPTTIQTRTPRTWTFTIPVQKTGTPGLNFDSVTMSFAGNNISCSSQGFDRGAASRTLECSASGLVGDHGLHDVTFTFDGTDDNGVDFFFERTFDDLLRIDNVLPLITFDAIGLPNGQTAGKSNDQVSVSGTIDPGEGGSDVEIQFVELRSTAGDVVEVNVTRSGNNFSGTATLNFPAAEDTDSETFRAVGQVRDEALQIGFGQRPTEIFDDVEPRIDPPAHVVQQEIFGSNPAIMVFIDETHELHGGCNTGLWRVQGNTVTGVRYSDGGECGVDDDPEDNVRVLILQNDVGPTGTPEATYDPWLLPPNALQDGIPRQGRLRDGAINRTATTVFDTISRILPGVPDLVRATRAGGEETAPLDEDAFWTRFGGNDLELTVAGIHAGWAVEVLDENGNVVREREAETSGEISVIVPIGNVSPGQEQAFERAVRFTNDVGDGEAQPFTVMLDRILPTIANATRTQQGDIHTVEVTFNEKIWNGDENAADFFVWEHRDDEDSQEDRWWYAVDKVTSAGRSDSWTLEIEGMRGDPFGSAEYQMVRPNGERLEDRAGNLMLNTF
jgi:hypothetical protein